MPSRKLLAIIALLALSAGSLDRLRAEDPYIYIRLSYKVVLNPATGTRPFGVDDADIDGIITHMNGMLATYWRGYRFVRVDPITNVGGLGGISRPNPSFYYGVDFAADPAARDELESDAVNNPGLYAWNSNAINVYINNGTNVGLCSDPGHEIIIIGSVGTASGLPRDAETHLHEIGHFFDLCHTQGCSCACCDSCNVPGFDNVIDTLPDRACWSPDDISNWIFGIPFLSIEPFQQELVRNVYFNVMSYHASGCGQLTEGTVRMTEGQLDRWTLAANSVRGAVVDGLTLPVQAGQSVAAAVADANPAGGDILLLYPGNYSESLSISIPLVLRATRQGMAAIGAGASYVPLRAPGMPESPPNIQLSDWTADPTQREPVRFGFPGVDANLVQEQEHNDESK